MVLMSPTGTVYIHTYTHTHSLFFWFWLTPDTPFPEKQSLCGKSLRKASPTSFKVWAKWHSGPLVLVDSLPPTGIAQEQLLPLMLYPLLIQWESFFVPPFCCLFRPSNACDHCCMSCWSAEVFPTKLWPLLHNFPLSVMMDVQLLYLDISSTSFQSVFGQIFSRHHSNNLQKGTVVHSSTLGLHHC